MGCKHKISSVCGVFCTLILGYTPPDVANRRRGIAANGLPVVLMILLLAGCRLSQPSRGCGCLAKERGWLEMAYSIIMIDTVIYYNNNNNNNNIYILMSTSSTNKKVAGSNSIQKNIVWPCSLSRRLTHVLPWSGLGSSWLDGWAVGQTHSCLQRLQMAQNGR